MCLSRLFLLEKARGQGIGRSIVAYAQKLAEGDGRSRLYLRVWAKDLKAEGFCKSAASAKARPSPWKSCPALLSISPPGKNSGADHTAFLKKRLGENLSWAEHRAGVHPGGRKNYRVFAVYSTTLFPTKQRAHNVRPYGWDAYKMTIAHYKTICRERS